MELHYVYDVNAPKKPVNLTANADLLKHAKNAGINLSKTFEEAVIAKLRTTLEDQWLTDNKEAIDAYNGRIARDGVFAANKRGF